MLVRMLTYFRRNHLALLALFVALGGTSYAAAKLPRNSVGPAQLQPNAVTSADVKNRTLRPQDFRRGTLLRGPKGATGPRGATGTVDTSNVFTKAQTDARYPRLASGTGTGDGPHLPSGTALVLRRVYSAHDPDNEVVAKVGGATFRRDASSESAFRVDNTGGSFEVNADCYGVTSVAPGPIAPIAKRATINAGVSALVMVHADAVEAFTCQLVYAANPPNQTQITLQQLESSNLWVGTLTSTDDQ
jgi:hypothetical protein